MKMKVDIVGAGLAGCEAAWLLAEKGVKVRLFEMKPSKMSPAHKLSGFAELVCSNSMRSDDPLNAAGLLKEEMREIGSLIMQAAEETRVPAGKALAVDRKLFSDYITEKISSHPMIEIINEEIISLGRFLEDKTGTSDSGEAKYTIVASGPLTSDKLSAEIAKLVGQEHLYFYDSVAPIVDAASIDFDLGYMASRYGYGGDDYWNFPLSPEQYFEFLGDLAAADKVTPHEFEDPKYFEGCLPIEVMAERGPETLRYGPMKPFGLRDPKTGEEPYALVQLRCEDNNRSMFNMVGFQTRLTWPEQKRIFKKFPGFENAEFLRLGVIHRNTYINSPEFLDERLALKSHSGMFFAGQITGVEGYIESAATGLWVGFYLANLADDISVSPPPHTTAIGSLIWHAANPNHRKFVPMNVNFGLMPIINAKIPKKDRKSVMLDRARRDFDDWLNPLKARRF